MVKDHGITSSTASVKIATLKNREYCAAQTESRMTSSSQYYSSCKLPAGLINSDLILIVRKPVRNDVVKRPGKLPRKAELCKLTSFAKRNYQWADPPSRLPAVGHITSHKLCGRELRHVNS